MLAVGLCVLAAAFIVPLISRGLAGATGIPSGLIVMLVLYVSTVRRAIADREDAAIAARIAQA